MNIRKKSDLALAKEVLALIKASVLSSEDIIPHTKLPHFHINEIGNYIEQFGKETLQRYIQYQQKIDIARSSCLKQFHLYEKKLKYPITANALAISLFGVGECGETANLGSVMLCEAGCTSPIYMISVSGKTNTLSKRPYCHAFILIGELPQRLLNIDLFSQLPDSCILLDPFLNLAGQANQLQQLMGTYLTTYEMATISSCDKIEANIVDTASIRRDADFLFQQAQANKQTSLTPTINTATTVFFKTQKNPVTACLEKIMLACHTIQRGDKIIEALTKSMPMAFRRACAFATAEIIELMINGRVLLANFDVNESSETQNKTALDWLQSNKVLSAAEKQTLHRKLVDAGALTYEQKNQTISPHPYG